MRLRDRWWVFDTGRTTGAAVVSFRWAWAARLFVALVEPACDYGCPALEPLKVTKGVRDAV